jgi:hypothetical protein
MFGPALATLPPKVLQSTGIVLTESDRAQLELEAPALALSELALPPPSSGSHGDIESQHLPTTVPAQSVSDERTNRITQKLIELIRPPCESDHASESCSESWTDEVSSASSDVESSHHELELDSARIDGTAKCLSVQLPLEQLVVRDTCEEVSDFSDDATSSTEASNSPKRVVQPGESSDEEILSRVVGNLCKALFPDGVPKSIDLVIDGAAEFDEYPQSSVWKNTPRIVVAPHFNSSVPPRADTPSDVSADSAIDPILPSPIPVSEPEVDVSAQVVAPNDAEFDDLFQGFEDLAIPDLPHFDESTYMATINSSVSAMANDIKSKADSFVNQASSQTTASADFCNQLISLQAEASIVKSKMTDDFSFSSRQLAELSDSTRPIAECISCHLQSCRKALQAKRSPQMSMVQFICCFLM